MKFYFHPDAEVEFLLAGIFNGEATFGLGEKLEKTIASPRSEAIFLARLSNRGNLVGVRLAAFSPDSPDSKILQYTVWPDGSVLVAGCFTGKATFGPDADGRRMILESKSEGGDIFYAKFGIGAKRKSTE
jgi:hypothetical protein